MSRTRIASTTAALVSFLASFLVLAPATHAAQQMIGGTGDPVFPPIPDTFDLELTPKEWARIQDGEIITQIVARGEEDRQARAIGYLKAPPLALFDIATDSELAPEIVSEVEEVVVQELRERGKRFHGRADFSFMLPEFQYTLVSAYNESRTGQAWAQLEGDFDKNQGTHAFFWDPERGETLAVMTFDFALKGILSMVPEGILVRMAKSTLPDFMRRVDEMTVVIAERDPARGARVATEWEVQRAELENGKYPYRVWGGFPVPEAPATRVTYQKVVDATELAAVDEPLEHPGPGIVPRDEGASAEGTAAGATAARGGAMGGSAKTDATAVP